MYDVITIGSATRDVFMEPNKKEMHVEKKPNYRTEKGICFGLGSKIDVPAIHFRTGGSAVNSAITFAKQGLRVAVICKTGRDIRGKSIFSRLKKMGVSTSLMIRDKKYFTAYSIILVAAGQRTIFVHRGATEYLYCDEPLPYKKLKNTKWLYITNLGGKSSKIFFPIINFAYKNGIKIALNPGMAQLSLGKEFIDILEKIDVLILNQEEASLLTKVAHEKEGEIFRKLDGWVSKGFVAMTKGPKGFVACDNEHVYYGGVLKEPLFMDRTGAGDAFGSGLVSGIIRGKSLEESIQLASANATGVLTEWGANHGLLGPNDDIYKFGKLKINKKPCEL